METRRAEKSGRTQRSGLQQRKQQLTVDAIVRAAQQGMREHGLDITIDVIAALAEVDRRTVFRHFGTREDIISAAFVALHDDKLRNVPPYSGGDWQDWLFELARWQHHTTAEARRMLWDFYTRQLSPAMAAFFAKENARHKEIWARAAAAVWQAAGGEGTTPELLRQTVNAHLSAMFTQAVLNDAEGTADLAAELATTAIVSTLRQLLGAPAPAAKR